MYNGTESAIVMAAAAAAAAAGQVAGVAAMIALANGQHD
jgi:hypothetical protein